jgi:hypothetical protein
MFIAGLIVCSLFLVAETSPVSAEQDGDYTYTVSGGVATVTGYNGSGGAIIMPSTLGGYATVAIGDWAFAWSSSLTSVIISDNITYLGNYAFAGCYNLTSVTIGSGVTIVGDGAFSLCTSLTSITIGRNVTTIGNYAFDFCTALTAINVDAGNLNFSSVDGVLYNKEITTLIGCPDGRAGALDIPSSVKSIGNGALQFCFNLTYVTIPDRVMYIGDQAFWGCTSLTSVTIPGNVTSIGDSAFYGCSSLISISFLGLVAPTVVGPSWIDNTGAGMSGHANAASNFPAPGGVWNGLSMGEVIPLTPVSQSNDNRLLVLVALTGITLVLVAMLIVHHKQKGKK